MRRRAFFRTTGIGVGCLVLKGAGIALARDDASPWRESRSACSCGTLAGEADLPYVQNPQTGVYTLILCPRVSVPGAFCFFCGGHPQGPWQTLVLLSSFDGSFWVWTKNPQTLKMAWRLWKWELQNLAPALMASCRSHGKHMVSHYAGQALQELGLRWPQEHLLDPQRWMPMSILGRAFCSSGWDHGIAVRNGYAPVRPFGKNPLAVPSPGG